MSQSPFHFPQLAYAESETGPLCSLGENQIEMQILEQDCLDCWLAPPPASYPTLTSPCFLLSCLGNLITPSGLL